jgi:diphosphomevalonate decarboxylase
MERALTSDIQGFDSFEKKVSYVSRLGSGSAARSVFGRFVVWGQSGIVSASSDEYAVPVDFKVHEHYSNLCDSIIVVSSKAKSISSSKGHRLMLTNPYADLRYKVAELNFSKLMIALKLGDTDTFVNIVENEALNLHAMFLTSVPGYILASPETLEIIDKIRVFRNKSRLFLCFTLDAGPNVHLLYPKSIQPVVHEFIKSELLPYCEKGFWIDDEMGNGPEEMTIGIGSTS